jgi:predicted transcriptional regulator
MKDDTTNWDKSIEKTLIEILKSRARSRIYIFLLRKKGAKTDQIIKGVKLHPSTIRETLSRMHRQRLVYRKKIKNDNIGKNPYIYYSISPLELIKRYSNEIENKLNKLASLTISKNGKENYKTVMIKIFEKIGET